MAQRLLYVTIDDYGEYVNALYVAGTHVSLLCELQDVKNLMKQVSKIFADLIVLSEY